MPHAHSQLPPTSSWHVMSCTCSPWACMCPSLPPSSPTPAAAAAAAAAARSTLCVCRSLSHARWVDAALRCCHDDPVAVRYTCTPEQSPAGGGQDASHIGGGDSPPSCPPTVQFTCPVLASAQCDAVCAVYEETQCHALCSLLSPFFFVGV